MKGTLVKIGERGMVIISYIFPFFEISSCFAVKVLLNTDSKILKYFYVNYVSELTTFYSENVYLIFPLMIGIFITCSRATVPFTKFVYFNIMQATLLNIVCFCISAIFPLIPLFLRESIIGLLLANFIYLGIIILVLYSTILIMFGRYPRIPILSEVARLQMQRGYLD